MGVTKQEDKNINVIKRIVDVALAILLAAAAFFGIKAITKDFSDIKPQPDDDKIIASSGDDKPLENTDIYVTEVVDNSEINSGSLIVVNSSLEYKGTEEDLVSLYDVRKAAGASYYTVIDKDVKVRQEAAEALNMMLKGFNEETGHKDIQVDTGYRSVKSQQQLYDAAGDTSSVAKPGYSDYHTGYSIDLSIVDEDGSTLDFDGTGDYEWLINNCYKYGYVVRFPDGKKEKTGYDYHPWHFRYVGVPHSVYMKENNLCLEEYIETLKTYDYNENHLKINDVDGNEYEVYYFPVSGNSGEEDSEALRDFTMLAVPSDKEYELSGNNMDGFIVTTLISGIESPSEENTESVSESGTTDKETTKNQ